MPPATPTRAWALARLAQIREIAEERQRWAEVQHQQFQPDLMIDPAQVAQEAEAARLEDKRLYARQQRLAAAREAEAEARARARAKRQAQVEIEALVEDAPVPEAPAPRAERRWDRVKQRWIKESP